MKQLNYFLACATTIAATFISASLLADSIVLVDKTTGHKYQRFDTAMNWTQARDYCKNTASPTGGYLVTVTSQSEQSFISGNWLYDGNYGSWIGLSDAQQQGVWQWVATTEKFSYTNWSTQAGQPSVQSGQYVYMGGSWSNFTWGDKWLVAGSYDANGNHGFICEWGGQAYKDYVGSATVNDMNANGFPEIATLYTNDANGKVLAVIKDASSKVTLSSITFGTPNKSFPLSMTVLPDMDANGFQEISVLLIDNITLKATQEIRDASTGALISSIPF
jgi:hypothetical protein